ncbi:type II toxin-antitoxin system VapB family antitoxin [Pseudofrankia sp. DC12]|uniref:type II toxin-antitoxin system VapB family antitoxin n=1 Tax=Pseudofrankia sp. DC12 TaxID=683315 RepID=UPI0005F8728C|nr:type II toxin-antitoxin system VapB family antitoxin [Pseudofrankia sp. DC12]
MALNIKNDEAQRLGRELAELTGESITTAVIVALRERLERVRAGSEPPQRRADRIVGLGRQIAVALRSHDLTVEDLYDDRGLPA